jgi:hypothetical protein
MADSGIVEFVGPWTGQLVATSIHAGHGLRPEIAEAMKLSDSDRFREEDPYTDVIASAVESRMVTHRSRFEVDLNRPRREAVYRSPEDAWELDIWRDGTLPEEAWLGSLAEWDEVYAALEARLDQVAARGPFVLLDVHSYNHRRDGVDAHPEPAAENPEVNVGTGSVDRSRFGSLVDRFVEEIAGPELGDRVDARENVKFEGRQLAWWVHDRYPRVGCVLALEFKKVFMDEWTGAPDRGAVERARANLAATIPGILDELGRLE